MTSATHEYNDGARLSTVGNFASYADFTAAAMAYGSFLRTNKRYAPAFLHTSNPEAFAQAVADANFATDPNYGSKLISIMRVEGLEQYDRV